VRSLLVILSSCPPLSFLSHAHSLIVPTSLASATALVVLLASAAQAQPATTVLTVASPLPVSLSRRTVTSATRLPIAMAPGGGQAIRIRAAR
jgi:hypothetical protein